MKRKSLEKAYEITDAKISFVSLVDKAANKRRFLLTKQEDGKAAFTTYGRIVKADADNHYVTGVVYEPMTEDVHGNYMTEDEITKACYWFTKNGNKVDLQHSFEPLPNATVVENWVAKADYDIDGEAIKKGTWLMTVEVADDEIWDGIEKGEITGFSMGGLGNYSEEDVDLSSIEKSKESSEKKSLLKQIGKALGFDVVEKGQVAEVFAKRSKADQFWSAFDALSGTLKRWDYMSDEMIFETDEEKIKEALTDFNEIITSILTAGEPIAKSLYAAKPEKVEKAGRSLSGKNKEALQGIYDSLGTFLAAFEEPEPDTKPVDDDPDNPDDGDAGDTGDGKTGNGDDDDDKKEPAADDNKKTVKKEDTDMTKQEVEGIVQEAVKKAVDALKPAEEPVKKSDGEGGANAVTPEAIQKMVDEAIQKAVQPQEETVTPEQVQQMVTKAVSEAITPLLKSRGLPTNLNADSGEKVEKSEQHYLHGIL